MAKVYVAAASAQLERAASAMDRLEAAGHEITHDWVKVILDRGEANPADATQNQRALWAREDLAGVEGCDVLWLLMPAETPTVGCFWEAGYAQALGKKLVISGCHERTIFAAGHACYDFDEAAFRAEFQR